MEHSRALDDGDAQALDRGGGEFVSLPPDDQKRVQQLLAGIGEEVTKDNPRSTRSTRRWRRLAQVLTGRMRGLARFAFVTAPN